MAPRDWNPDQLVVMGIAMLVVLGLAVLLFHLGGRYAGEYAMITLWALLILVPLSLLGVKQKWFDGRKRR